MIDNETTTNTEISTVDLNELAELDRKYSDGRDSGSSGSKDGFSLPVLKVSYASSPDPHRGQMTVNHNGKDLFAKTVWFRPLVNTFKWQHFDFDTNQMMVETIEVRNLFEDEPIDTKGTLRCGKPPSKGMSDEQRNKWKHISYSRILRGLVDIGDEKNIPCIMFLKGGNRDRIWDQYISKISRETHIRTHKVEISVERQKKGAIEYFTLNFSPDLSKVLPVDQPTIDTWKIMQNQIDEKNAIVREKYTKALKENNLDTASIDVLKNALNEELSDDDEAA